MTPDIQSFIMKHKYGTKTGMTTLIKSVTVNKKIKVLVKKTCDLMSEHHRGVIGIFFRL
jgi:hypothetical protein